MSADRLSVAFVSPGWPPGRVQNGIVTYIGNLRPALEQVDIETHVLAEADPAPSPGSDGLSVNLHEIRTPHLRRTLFRVMRKVPALRSVNLLFGWAVAQGLEQLQTSHRLDLVEMEESFGAAYYLQSVTALPVVVRLHGPWFLNGTALGVPIDEEFHRRDQAERRCIAQAASITAPSRDLLRRVRDRFGLLLPSAAVIPNPAPIVPPEHRWRLDACDRNSLLFVGRFDRHKGGDLIIDAFRQVAEMAPQAVLTFVGPDVGLKDDEGRTYQAADYVTARLPPAARARVRLLGPLPADRIATLRRQAYVTVVASRDENFPLALAESLAHGCPTVAANAGGMPEILTEEQTGLLFRAGDSADLAAKILTLFAESERAAALGAAAAADTARRFAPSVVARATRDHYEALLEEWPPPRIGGAPYRALYALTGLV